MVIVLKILIISLSYHKMWRMEKLIDELTKGRKMEKILRKQEN